MPSSPQQRRRRIRRTVGAAGLATFAIAWGVIAGTGAMGHSTSTAATTQSAQRSSDDDGGFGFAGDDGGQSAQSQQQLPQLTTRQS